MWIVYRKKDRKVVGMSAVCEPDLEKEAALAEVVKGLVQGGAPEKYDALQVKDAARALEMLSAPPEEVAISDAKGKLQAVVEKPRRSFLLVSCDAPDVHPADGIAEIKADGTSFTTVEIQKVSERGEPEESRNDNEQVYLRTTAGTILDADGQKAATSVKLKQGKASFRLVSEKARRLATVTLFTGDPALHEASIRVEFI
jgi:hypothetical protein